MNIKIKMILQIQLLVLMYSVVGTLSKVISNFIARYGVLSLQVIITLGISVGALGIYAILWQKVLKKVDLTIAYANKGIGLLWTLVWSVCIFDESITSYNIIGIIFICVGVMVVTIYE